jgi:hypothetical protein
MVLVDGESFGGEIAGFPSVPSAFEHGDGVSATGELVGDFERVWAGEIGAIEDGGLAGESGLPEAGFVDG